MKRIPTATPEDRQGLDAGRDRPLHHEQAHPGQHRRPRKNAVVQEQLQLGPDLRRQRVAQHVLHRVVQAGLQAVAHDEQEERRRQHRSDRHGREADQREKRQGHERVLDAELVQDPGRHEQADEKLHHVARKPSVADEDGQRLQVVVRRLHEQHGDQVVADAACDLKGQGQQDQGEHQAAARHVVECSFEHCHDAVLLERGLLVGEELVGSSTKAGRKSVRSRLRDMIVAAIEPNAQTNISGSVA